MVGRGTDEPSRGVKNMTDRTNLKGDKDLTVRDLEKIEAVLGIRLPDNCVIEIRELSAEELDLAASGRPIAVAPRLEGTFSQLHFHRAGDDLFKLSTDYVSEEQV